MAKFKTETKTKTEKRVGGRHRLARRQSDIEGDGDRLKDGVGKSRRQRHKNK